LLQISKEISDQLHSEFEVSQLGENALHKEVIPEANEQTHGIKTNKENRDSHFLTSSWKGPTIRSMRSVLLHSSAQILLAEMGSKGVFFRYSFLGVVARGGVLGGVLGAMATAADRSLSFSISKIAKKEQRQQHNL